jgi:hypothetical protein
LENSGLASVEDIVPGCAGHKVPQLEVSEVDLILKIHMTELEKVLMIILNGCPTEGER